MNDVARTDSAEAQNFCWRYVRVLDYFTPLLNATTCRRQSEDGLTLCSDEHLTYITSPLMEST